MDHESIGKLTELEFLMNNLDAADQFEELYGRLLNENKQDKEMLRAMQRLLFKQGAFLTDEWVKAKRAAPAPMRLTEYGKWN